MGYCKWLFSKLKSFKNSIELKAILAAIGTILGLIIGVILASYHPLFILIVICSFLFGLSYICYLVTLTEG